MLRKTLLFTFLMAWTFFFGCKTQPESAQGGPAYDRPLPPGMHALRKITDPAQIPDFTVACLDLQDLRESIANSLSYLSKPSSRGFFPSGDITHARTVESLEAFLDLLESGLGGGQLNQAIREKFDVYISIGCDDHGTVLFTGYYTPIFDGSPTRTERFKYPLYEQPDNLVKGPNGEILGRRMSDGELIPYPQRAVIEAARMLRGKELIWLGQRRAANGQGRRNRLGPAQPLGDDRIFQGQSGHGRYVRSAQSAICVL